MSANKKRVQTGCNDDENKKKLDHEAGACLSPQHGHNSAGSDSHPEVGTNLFLESEAVKDPISELRKLEQYIVQMARDSPRALRFRNISLKCHVHQSVLELSSSQKAASVVWNRLCEVLKEEIPDEEWNFKGEIEQDVRVPSRIQLIRHFQSATFLFCRNKDEPMTAEIIKKMHLIVTGKALLQGVPMNSGQYRRSTISSSPHGKDLYMFPRPEDVPELVETACARYERERQAYLLLKKVPIDLGAIIRYSTRLYYDVVNAAPFRNGTKRIARLLLAYAINRDGFPFVLSFSAAKKIGLKSLFVVQAGYSNEVEDRLANTRTLVLESCIQLITNFDQTVPKQYVM